MMQRHTARITRFILTTGISIAIGAAAAAAQAPAVPPAPPVAPFGPSNPFYAASTLPFQAPPFNRIKDSDYQPAIEAGIAEQLKEIDAIANNTAPPDFANTLVALEKSGQLLARVGRAFSAVTGADTDPELQK